MSVKISQKGQSAPDKGIFLFIRVQKNILFFFMQVIFNILSKINNIDKLYRILKVLLKRDKWGI